MASSNAFADSQSHPSHPPLYPNFISVTETFKLHLSFMIRGAWDACRWDLTVKAIYSDAEIRSQVFKSLTLNVLSLSSLYVFDHLLLPLVKGRKSHIYINWSYRIFWLFPLAAGTLYLNGTWADIVARRNLTLQHGRRAVHSPATYRGLMTVLASSAYRMAMIITSFTLDRGLSYVPHIGYVSATLFACWINAYYCFESTWIAGGLTPARRVNIVEERWAYFLAFGVFTAIPCSFLPGLGGTILFALLLPFFVLKATNATPVPKNPYSPLAENHTNQSAPVYPSPFIPIRLPIFTLVLTIDNLVISLINFATFGRSRIKLKERHCAGEFEVIVKSEEGNLIYDSMRGNLNARRKKQ